MLRSTIPAAMLALTAGAAAMPASAATVDPMGQFTDTAVSGTFRDVFTFSLGQTSMVNATYSGTPATLQVTDFGIYSGATELTTFVGYSVFNNVFGGTDSVSLMPGDYTVQLAATVTSGTAKFNGNLNVSAVPLPPAVALFGAGLMALGGFGFVRGRLAGRAG